MSAYKKLLEVQREIKAIEKDSTNPHFKSSYFDINKLIADVKPILNKHGLVALQPIDYADGQEFIRTIIVDTESGETIESRMRLTGNADPQKYGSEITYKRRYSLTSMLLLEGEDDDGEAASGRAQPQQQVKTANSTATQKTDGLGVCAKCGAPNRLSQAGKAYCSKLCWKNPPAPAQELPTIQVEQKADDEIKLEDIPF